VWEGAAVRVVCGQFWSMAQGSSDRAFDKRGAERHQVSGATISDPGVLANVTCLLRHVIDAFTYCVHLPAPESGAYAAGRQGNGPYAGRHL